MSENLDFESSHQFSSGGGPLYQKKKFSFATEDILAVGMIILAVGGVIVAIIVAIGLAEGHIDPARATKIILGCVGSSAVFGVIARMTAFKKAARRS